MSTKDEPKYGWRTAEIGGQGPYDSLDQAKAAALSHLKDLGITEGKFETGRLELLDPGQWISMDMDEIAESMDLCAQDFGFPGDDEIFHCASRGSEEREQAVKELAEFLAEWARKYYCSGYFDFVETTEHEIVANVPT